MKSIVPGMQTRAATTPATITCTMLSSSTSPSCEYCMQRTTISITSVFIRI